MTSVFWALVRKDLYLMRGFMVATVAGGLLAFIIAGWGRTGFAVGGILFLTVNVASGIFIAMLSVLTERVKNVRLFVLSLPISGQQYAIAKLVSTWLIYGIPWVGLTAIAILAFVLSPEAKLGMVVYAVMLQGFVLALFSLVLAALYVIKSEPLSGIGILAVNIGFSLFMVWVNQPEITRQLSTDTITWPPFSLAMLAGEGLVDPGIDRFRDRHQFPHPRPHLIANRDQSFPTFIFSGGHMKTRVSCAFVKAIAAVSATALTVALACMPIAARAQAPAPPADPFADPYKETCAACHGANMEGTPQGVPLAGTALRHGDSVDAIAKSIADGFAQGRMPAFSATMDTVKIKRLATFIGEKRADLSYADFRIAAPPAVPAGVIRSEAQSFRVETVATGLTALPYSIAPLPDGSILLAEKTGGLRIISTDGVQSAPIRGTPQTFNDGFQVPGILLVYGMGYLLDVAPHPDYAKNGWIYLSFTERCSDCNAASRKSKQPASMVVLVRGRIRNGEWVDQQAIWKTDIENYTAWWTWPPVGAWPSMAGDMCSSASASRAARNSRACRTCRCRTARSCA